MCNFSCCMLILLNFYRCYRHDMRILFLNNQGGEHKFCEFACLFYLFFFLFSFFCVNVTFDHA